MGPRKFFRKLVWLSKQPAFTIFQILLKNIPLLPVRIEDAYFIRFDGIPSVPDGLLKGPGQIRKATPRDIDGLLACRNLDDAFARRFESGDYCVIASANERILGYEWFCATPNAAKTHYGYNFKIPPEAVYIYDSYVLPEFRSKGIWLRFKFHLSQRMTQWNKSTVLAFVDYGNWRSLKTHLRFGFRIIERVRVIRVSGKLFIHQRPASTRHIRKLAALLGLPPHLLHLD